MELNFIENTKNRILFELRGADHTVCNLLSKELWNDENVKVSAYKIEHPLTAVPVFIVETKKESAIDAVKNAIKRITALNKKFLTNYSKMQ